MRSSVDGTTLTMYLEGRISTVNAEEIQRRIDALCEANPDLNIVFDASSLGYISSAGLRCLLNVARRSKARVSVRNVPDETYDIFRITGVIDLIDVSRKLRSISVEGKEVVGKGRSATVYRLDDERIVKCYVPNVPLCKIEREMELASQAYAIGIPTAQVFELVQVGSNYGIIFELIDGAETIGHVISAHPERFDELSRDFALLWRRIHQMEVPDTEAFPSVKETWGDWADGMARYYSSSENDFIREMIDAVPDRLTMDHCDYHENNVMVDADKLVLIDMVDIGYGHPIFDLAGLAFRVHCDSIAGRGAHRGLTPEDLRRLWDQTLRTYFDTDDDATIDDIKELCRAFGYLRSALFPMKHVQISEQLRNLHIADARTNLLCYQDWARKQLSKLDTYFS